MAPHNEAPEAVGQGIDEARAKIVATRESLQAILDREIDVSVRPETFLTWKAA